MSGYPHEDAEAQHADVEAILAGLGIDPASDRRLMEVNKCDLLGKAALAARRRPVVFAGNPVMVSALTGQGLEDLRRN